ncbi:polysaccharide biosynthesis protein [Cellulophaga sp. HaHaR_3_176]|nr:polysaccharide biosynthesis protein [Cellulophaga sp. HaHaR_3_176]
MSNFTKNKELPKLFSVLLDQVLMSVVTLLTSVVLARTFDKVQYADLVLLFTLTLFSLGFQSSIISKPYAINQNDLGELNKESYYQFNLNLKLIFTVGVVFVFPFLYYFSFDVWDFQRFSIFLFYIISYTSYFFIRETLLSERKTKENLKYGIFCATGLVSLLLYILFSNNKNINFFLIVASTIYSLVSAFYFISNYKKIKLPNYTWLQFWNINWKIGKWLLGSNFLFHISSSIYPWLLLYITEKKDIAVFGVLISVAALVNPLLTALSSYLLPLFVSVNSKYDKIKELVGKWNILFALMAIVLVIIGVFLGQNIIVLLYGEKYQNLGILVIFPFIVQAINVFAQPFKIALNAIKRTDVNFWILIPRSIISVVLGFLLINRFGLVGVFYTMIFENLFYQISYYIIYRKVFKF